jgi:IS1 family transposase
MRRALAVCRCKQKNVTRANIAVRGDQYTFIALASSAKAIIAYRTGKRDSENTDLFIRDLRERVLGTPEISTDGFLPYRPAARGARRHWREGGEGARKRRSGHRGVARTGACPLIDQSPRSVFEQQRLSKNQQKPLALYTVSVA